jgi:hypothetical protein
MIQNSIAHYVGALNTALTKHGVNPNSVLWISNGKNRISYADFMEVVRSIDYNQRAKFDGLMIAGADFWITIEYVANASTGRSFTFQYNRVVSDKMTEYGLFLKRSSGQSLLTPATLTSFFA